MPGQAAYVVIVADAFCHKILPHLASPYKGEGQDAHSFRSCIICLFLPLLCKEGLGEVESDSCLQRGGIDKKA